MRKLIELAKAAGGDAPLPTAPPVAEIEDLERLVGNEQLAAIKTLAADVEAKIKSWSGLRDLACTRKPVWDLVQGLARHGRDLDDAKPHVEQLNAIREQRLLLAPSDPIAPLRVAVAQCLRDAANEAYEAHESAASQALESLGKNEVWKKLSPVDQTAILDSVGLVLPAKPVIATDEALLQHLDTRPLAVVRTEVDAISGRLQQAIEQAAKRLEPEVQTIALERVTLRTEADVNAWLARTKTKLIDAVRNGPVLVK